MMRPGPRDPYHGMIGPGGGPMASFLTFYPPLHGLGTVEIRDFYLGNSDGKGADGRAYPAHMRRLWVRDVREAIALMMAIPRTEKDRNLPSVEPIRQAIAMSAIFTRIVVVQPKRRVMMYSAKIAGYMEWFNEPNQMHLTFEKFSEDRNWP